MMMTILIYILTSMMVLMMTMEKILVIIIITLIITFFIKIIPDQGRKHERGTAKDYQRPQPAKQVMLMNRDDDEHNDNAGAALRSAPRF